MDAKLKLLNRELKAYDRDLYAIKLESGMYQVYREGRRIERFEWKGKTFGIVRPNPHFILALTDTWRVSGKPYDWSVDRVLDWLKEFDNHKNGDQYGQMVKNREREENLRDRAFKNEIRARAADSRKDFARAFSEVNTANLEKIDRRRLKGA